MGTFITEEILSEGGITGTTISGGTYYGDGSNLTGVSSGEFTGGTVTGATIFTGGLSANNFSATTINGDGSNLTGIVPTSRNINTSSPLNGGGDLTADRTISISQSNTTTDGYLSSTDWNTFNNKVPTGRTISTTSPLSGGGDLSTNRTISIADAVADGVTKGAATFTTNDFDSSSGVISIDYTNGQAASSSLKGFLTSSDWTTFNNKSRLQYNYSTAPQVIAGNNVTYITNSNITTANILAGTIVTWVISASRTGNSNATPAWTVRFGTNSSTADATLLTFTTGAQSNVLDTGQIVITCVFRSVGSGITAVLTGHLNLTHNLTSTGMSNVPANNVFATSAGFNSTTANAFLGLTLNPGANATWTINQMYVKIEDIA